MAHRLIDLGQGFSNIRGSFRVAGVVDVRTQCSLVEVASGRFLFLDSYTLEGDVREEVLARTDGGTRVEAILNLHPFHTMHCAAMHALFPNATLYGSRRHRERCPELPWAQDLVESASVAERYPQLEFALPEGIDYISADESVHAGSLLAYHPASRSLHVDDTISVLPGWLKPLLPRHRRVFLHPTLRKALKPEPGAGRIFCDWMDLIGERWAATRHLCAAHSGVERFETGEFTPVLRQAVTRVRRKLEHAH